MTEYTFFDETAVPDQKPCISSGSRQGVSSPVPAVRPSMHAYSSSLERWNAVRERQISRRRLLALIGISAEIVATTALLAVCSLGSSNAASSNGGTATPTRAPQALMPGEQALAHVADVPVNSAHTFPIANHENPGVLIHLSDQRFVAFNSTCTHEQCAVSYDQESKLLECPCHGAIFDPAQNAALVQGPATVPLKSIKNAVQADGTITMA